MGQRLSIGKSEADSGGVRLELVCEVVRGLVMESFGGEEKGFKIYTVFDEKIKSLLRSLDSRP